jgi:hypothetical protein
VSRKIQKPTLEMSLMSKMSIISLIFVSSSSSSSGWTIMLAGKHDLNRETEKGKREKRLLEFID